LIDERGVLRAAVSLIVKEFVALLYEFGWVGMTQGRDALRNDRAPP
jgi:hypothetical protein